MEAYLLILFKILYLEGLTVQLEYFDHLVLVYAHNCTPQKSISLYRAAITIFQIIFDNIKFKELLKLYSSVITHWGSTVTVRQKALNNS